MKRYRAPAAARPSVLPIGAATTGPPRDFEEWSALRRWGRLPAAEQEIPGYLLRVAREACGLTQREMALRLGVSQPAVAQAERWGSNPTIAFLRSWADACGCEAHVELKTVALDRAAESPGPYRARPSQPRQKRDRK